MEVQFQSDRKFYSRFFTEIFLYLDKTELSNNWRGVVVYPSRNIDTGETQRYEELLNLPWVRRIYLDEFYETSTQSLGIETVNLVIVILSNCTYQSQRINKPCQTTNS